MSNEIQLGSVVRLKGESLKMTLDMTFEHNGKQRAKCYWINQGEVKEAAFALTSLRLHEDYDSNGNYIANH